MDSSAVAHIPRWYSVARKKIVANFCRSAVNNVHRETIIIFSAVKRFVSRLHSMHIYNNVTICPNEMKRPAAKRRTNSWCNAMWLKVRSRRIRCVALRQCHTKQIHKIQWECSHRTRCVTVWCGMLCRLFRNIPHDAAWRRKSSFTSRDACI